MILASYEGSRPHQQVKHQKGRLPGCCEPASLAFCGQEYPPASCELIALLETTL